MTISRHQQQLPKYRELISITEEVVENARRALQQTQNLSSLDPLQAALLQQLRREIADYGELGDQVIDQTRRRVLKQEQVPASEKIYSIFEPHTDLIKRGKVDKPIEFGHKVFLAESAQGLITQYEVLQGNPNDEEHVPASLQRHKETFGHAPDLYGADRGFHSAENEHACQQDGVAVVAIPQCGGQKTAERAAYENSAEFKKGQRFRVGIEGRISVLFPRSGHEALLRPRAGTIRYVSGCGRARQQFVTHCRFADRKDATSAPRKEVRCLNGPSKFVKHHPGSLVTGQTELALQEQGGHATLVGGHSKQVPSPVFAQ